MQETELKPNHMFINMDITKDKLSTKKNVRNIKDKEEWNNIEKNKKP